MRTIREGVQFRRDLKRELRGQYRATLAQEFEGLVQMLAGDELLPVAKRDHALVGSYRGSRDCHIRPDLVLIYRKLGDDVLELMRLGSHSELDL